MTYFEPTCRGSIRLGTGCKSCRKCQEELDQMAKWNVPSEDKFLKPLAVSGYTEQKQESVDLVNENKVVEELALRQVDRHVRNQGSDEIDQCLVALARTHMQIAFMCLNRAVFQPKRLRNEDMKANADDLYVTLMDI